MNEVNFPRRVKEVQFGAWRLDPTQQLIFDGEVERELEPLIFRVLSYLILNSDKVITRHDLQKDVWCQHYVDDNAINRAMSELRKVLKSEQQKGIVVKTHYGKGYSFFLEPHFTFHDSPELTPSVHLSKQDLATPPAYKYRVIMSCMFLALICIPVTLFYLMDSEEIEPVTQSYDAQLLSWGDGQYNGLLLHKSEQLLAYMYSKTGEKSSSIIIRDLQSAKEFRFSQNGFYLYPVGWSYDGSKLLYTVQDEGECELWETGIAEIEASQRRFLFQCDKRLYRAAEMQNGDIAYTKYGYRDRPELSAIYIRSLSSNSEFQISSPNLNSFGDKLLYFDARSNKLFFERVQYGFSELFMIDPEGTEQFKLTVLDHRIWLLNLNERTQTLSWFNSEEQQVYMFSLSEKHLSKIIKPTNVDKYNFSYLLSNDSLLAVTDPYEQDIYTLMIKGWELGSYVQSPAPEWALSTSSQLKAFFSRATTGSKVLVLDDGEKMQRLSLPEQSVFSAKISPKGSQVALLSATNITLYDTRKQAFKPILKAKGELIFTDFIDDKYLGFIERDPHLGKYVTYLYNLNTGKKSKLPVAESTWFGKLAGNEIVFKKLQGQLMVYDMDTFEVLRQLKIAENQFRHSFSTSGEMIYHSDGFNVYAIDSKTNAGFEQVVYRYPGRGHIHSLEAAQNDKQLFLEVITSKANYLVEAKKNTIK
jgi:DNA-binding winged helix-turn-helix (wHTH) protein/WD40 repeat protein